jgi:DNA mismatch repair protein MutS
LVEVPLARDAQIVIIACTQSVAVKQSPLIAQYLGVKQRVPDAILFFRLGDFYEMMFEDAEVGARVLNIQLTSRSKDGIPLCGVPFHAAEPYIAKLLKAGHKVAICEQTASEAKTGRLMPREIVRVITPGTVGEEIVLTASEKSYLLAIAADERGYAIAALDVSTGEFIATAMREAAALREEVARLAPREIIVAPAADDIRAALGDHSAPLTALDATDYAQDSSRAALLVRFPDSASLANSVAHAAGAALMYVERTFGTALAHLEPPRIYQATEFMAVDETTRGHLELVASSDGSRRGSLLSILDETITAIGARTLARWIVFPLVSIEAISARHDAVEELFNADLGGAIASALKAIGDLERTCGRIGSLRASPRDCLRLAGALEAVAMLKSEISRFRSPVLRDLAEKITAQPELVDRIVKTLSDEPPVNPRDGNVIRAGFDSEIDELRSLASGARDVIARLEASERKSTGIGSLKVRYNQIFGYYIEVTKLHLDRVPAGYERKQTLVGAERFTTGELKELERKILSAESGLKELEHRIFARLLADLSARSVAILESARAVGEFDALMSLAVVARRRGYVRPSINGGLRVRVHDGRHPVLEAAMRTGEFVPNDLDADPDSRQILLITGPNMAGKSTYLRQVALIVIMAQTGSFVPAAEASIGLVDRVLTRIGARDDLRRGASTFMVEMSETARLLDGLTERSLLLLDEVGRGTSTFDGLAIAWAVAEYLHDQTRAKVLFATHFHELTDLARERARVRNLSMAVREWAGEVIFLRRVVEQPSSRSYGIEVARLAGLPDSIVARAREILANLEQGELDEAGMPRLAHQRHASAPQTHQMNLFATAESRAIEEIRALDIERTTPIDAMAMLARLKSKITGGDG